MKALIYDEFQMPPRIDKVSDPSVKSNGAIIKVKATGLCRSDWHGWMGHDKDIILPHVPGHEFAGEIVELGPEVQRWKIGERVTAPFVCACGNCAQCIEGNQQVCRNQFQPGFTAWGSFAEYVAIENADINLVSLPEKMSYITAASLGCRFATSFRAVIDQAKIREDQWISIFGCGGVGLSALMIAKAVNANVIAVDIDQEKLKLAESLGADECINSKSSQDLISEVRSLSNGGVHASIDAIGERKVFANSIRCLRPRGKHIQVGILPPRQALQAIPVYSVLADELEILGSHGMQAHRYPVMLKMIEEGKLNPNLLIGEKINLEQAATTLTRMDRFESLGMTVISDLS